MGVGLEEAECGFRDTHGTVRYPLSIEILEKVELTDQYR